MLGIILAAVALYAPFVALIIYIKNTEKKDNNKGKATIPEEVFDIPEGSCDVDEIVKTLEKEKISFKYDNVEEFTQENSKENNNDMTM